MHYFDISLELKENFSTKVTPELLKKNIEKATIQLIGRKGLECNPQILKYDSSKKRFILCCESSGYMRFRAALTLASTFESEPCIYVIHGASSHPLSFAANSRTYEH